MKSRARSWMPDEVVLALDLYLRSLGVGSAQEHRELSDYLRAWPVEPELAANPQFRNTAAVANKLYNLQYLDTDGDRGRENGGEATEKVWAEFGRDVTRVAEAAAAVRVAVVLVGEQKLWVTEEEIEADETNVVLRVHRSRERSRKLVQRKRERVLASTGALACEACGFDSKQAWGVPGIIECHHVKPLYTVEKAKTTRLADLRLLCPNCHRLVHASQPWLEWHDLLSVVRP